MKALLFCLALIAASANAQDVTESTIQLLVEMEGFSPYPYRDGAGYSIGYGHYLGARPSRTWISEPEAFEVLRWDVRRTAGGVKALAKVKLTQNKFDALTSLTMSIGVGALAKSTLLKKLNAGDVRGAAREFRRWTISNGVRVPGLVTRRKLEAQLFLLGYHDSR